MSKKKKKDKKKNKHERNEVEPVASGKSGGLDLRTVKAAGRVPRR